MTINMSSGSGPNAGSSTRWLRLLAVAVIVGFFAALGAIWWVWFSDANSPPEEIVAGVGESGSDAYLYLEEVAELLESQSGRVRLKIVPTRDPSQNISLLNRKAIDLAVVRGDTPLGGDARVVAILYPDYFQFIMNSAVSAFDVRDLVGKRIALPEFGTDAHRSFFAIADHYDLPVDKVKWEATDIVSARKGLISGKYDGIFTVRSLRDPQLVTLFEDAQLKHINLSYLPIRQAEAIGLKRPFIKAGRIPYGSFTGAGPVPAADLPTAYVERVLVSRSDVSNTAIRALTAAMFERRLELTLRFPLAASVSEPDSTKGVSVAVHDGAIQFYEREKPSVFEAYSDQIGLILTLFAMAGSGVIALRSRLVSAQKDRADVYNYKLLELLDKAKAAEFGGSFAATA